MGPIDAIWLLVEIHGRNGVVVDSKMLQVGPAELNTVQDETDPGDEFEEGADYEAHNSTVPNPILVRCTIGVIAVALIHPSQVFSGTLRGVGAPGAKQRASGNE